MSNEKTYPSDLSNREWEIIKPLIPIYKRGRKRSINMREIINGVVSVKQGFCLTRFHIKVVIRAYLATYPDS